MVAVLKGSFVFAADLIRALYKSGCEPEVDFLTLSSYRKSKTSSGKVEILRDLDLPVEGRNVILVDDVLDSGRTLAFAKDLIYARGAKRTTNVFSSTSAFPVPSTARPISGPSNCGEEFVVGYGMDAAYRYRELPFVVAL